MSKNLKNKYFTGLKCHRIALHLIILILLTPFQLFSQDVEKPRANYELAEKFTRDKIDDLIHDTRLNATWLEGLDQFWYRFKNDDGTAFYLVDPARQSKAPVFDNAALAAELSQFLHKPYDPKQNPGRLSTGIDAGQSSGPIRLGRGPSERSHTDQSDQPPIAFLTASGRAGSWPLR